MKSIDSGSQARLSKVYGGKGYQFGAGLGYGLRGGNASVFCNPNTGSASTNKGYSPRPIKLRPASVERAVLPVPPLPRKAHTNGFISVLRVRGQSSHIVADRLVIAA